MLRLPDEWILPLWESPLVGGLKRCFFTGKNPKGNLQRGEGPGCTGLLLTAGGCTGPGPHSTGRSSVCAVARSACLFIQTGGLLQWWQRQLQGVAGVRRRRAVFSWNLGSGPLSRAVVPSHCRQGAGASALHPGRPHAGVALTIDMPACRLLADTPLPCPRDPCWAFQAWSLDGSRPLATSEPRRLCCPPARPSRRGGLLLLSGWSGWKGKFRSLLLCGVGARLARVTLPAGCEARGPAWRCTDPRAPSCHRVW